MFVDTSRIAVTVDGEIDVHNVTPDMDVIYIRKKMDFGTRQKVISAAITVGGGKDGTEIDVGAWQLALGQHNILDWAGPSFDGVPCIPKNILRLDPDTPILAMALACIGERNTGGMIITNPKQRNPTGVTPGAASVSPVASGISLSLAPFGSDGQTAK